MGSAAPWYRKGGTSVELSIPCSHWRESIGRKRGRGGGQCKGKLQVPRQGVKAEAKKLHETYIDGLLIKIVEKINKDQHSSANLTQESVIGELKQPGGSVFDYLTTAEESSWEPRGVLQSEQKIEDSAKGEEMQRLQRLRRGRRRNKWGRMSRTKI
ncbi:hypothetical protein BHE74_00040968 [Ensete ventricosum]|nr:hypothetical protein BHE74_00040968 [Ensete ventricosum]